MFVSTGQTAAKELTSILLIIFSVSLVHGILHLSGIVTTAVYNNFVGTCKLQYGFD